MQSVAYVCSVLSLLDNIQFSTVGFPPLQLAQDADFVALLDLLGRVKANGFEFVDMELQPER